MPPEVKSCAVTECYYNIAEYCHANAILVGRGHPACDTFIIAGTLHGEPAPIGEVGACHQADCKFNDELSCHAGSIDVGRHDSHADCVTYEPLPKASEEIDVALAMETPRVQHEHSQAVRLSGLEED